MKTREATGGKSVTYTDAKRNAASPTTTIRFANAIFLLLSPRCFVQPETILSHRLSQLPVSLSAVSEARAGGDARTSTVLGAFDTAT